MLDSELVGVGGEVAAGFADLPVVPEAGGEGQQAQADPGAETGEGAGAVALEAELAFAGPEDRFDPLADVPERAVAARLVLAVGAQKGCPPLGDEALEVLTREAFVCDEHVAGERHSLEQLFGDLALGGVGGCELEGDRGAVSSAHQVEPEAPEVARVRAAVAVAGAPGELRAAGRLARLAAGHRRRVEQPDAIAKGRRDEGQVVDRASDL